MGARKRGQELSAENSFEEKIIEQPLEKAIHDYMMPYAESVILDRALPRVEDGLKPVQRRILYTMNELNMKPDGPYKKSARVVGDCLGKYHPHGDSSVYDAMVKMAQDFNMRNILVDGNGNFGSIDGDSAAAMRYTEVKLAPLACELLRDLDKDTVKWNKNFDDSLKEPDVLPGRFPNLLVNGSAGIAIGLATKIPPHNLTEVIDGTVAVIDNPKITIEELLGIIKGPDFPTGGFITEGDSFAEIYSTGKGKIVMRAKVDIENEASGRQNIVIHEIPYNVNKSTLQIRIKELRDELAEKNGKNNILGGIQEIVDESDRNGIRVAIKLKKGDDATKVLDYLYQKTDLQCNFNVNMIAIADGRPQQLGLIQILKYYIAHQREVILRRSQFDLNNAKKREHILDGFAKILPDIDNVVAIIKTSNSRSEARDRLRQTYDLSEKQADAILDLRLVNLTKLEVGKIEKELADIKKLIAKLTKIVNSKAEQLAVVREELLEIRNKYRTKRLTTIVKSLDEIEHKPYEAGKTATKRGFVLCGADGTLRFAGKVEYLNSGSRTKPADKNDVVKDQVYADGTSVIYAFTDKGNCVRVNPDDIADGRSGKGTEIFEIAKEAAMGERCIRLMTFSENDMDKELYFFTRNGMVKKSYVREYVVNKNFYQGMIIKDDDEVINVEIRQEDTSIFMISDDGFCVNIPHEEFNVTGRKSGGVIGMNLNDKATVIFAGQLEQDPIDKVAAGEILFITKTGYAKRVYAMNIESMKRARKGDNQIDVKRGDILYAGVVTNAYDIAIIHRDGKVDIVNTEDVQISRVARSKGKPCPAAEDGVYALKHCGNL